MVNIIVSIRFIIIIQEVSWLPTQTELNEYNKVKHSNYSMQQIKTRLWKLFNYQKTRNPDYYVKPRRVELLPEIKNLWESGK